MEAVLMAALMMMAQATGGSLPPVTLACDISARGGVSPVARTPSERTFRVGPGTFQEWDEGSHAFGPNLCEVFTCVRTPDRVEGAISSASVIYTVGVETATGQGYWSAIGATNQTVNRGACRVVPEPKSRTP